MKISRRINHIILITVATALPVMYLLLRQDEKYVNVAVIHNVPRDISVVRAHFSKNGIQSICFGSIGMSITVPESQSEQAKEILKGLLLNGQLNYADIIP